MAETPEETIVAAATAYIAGDNDALYQQLAHDVRVVDSEQPDSWAGREDALSGLGPELERRRISPNSVRGSLVESLWSPDTVEERGGIAWWSVSGDLEMDDTYHRMTSWTVVMRRDGENSGGDWRIVHSHFSIHR